MAGKSLGLWWRFYVSTLDNSKLDRLSDSAYRGWTKLICVATENGGIIPDNVKDLSFRLRKPAGKVREWLQAALSAGLLERCDGGFVPHNWEERQFNSTVSTGRVKQFRDKQKKRSSDDDETVSETHDETFHETSNETGMKRPHRTETEETETETEKKKTTRAATSAASDVEIPDWIPPDAWAGFCEMRRKKRAVLTGRAIGGIIADLEKLKAMGNDPGSVLDQSTKNAWAGVFELKAGTPMKIPKNRVGFVDLPPEPIPAIPHENRE